MSSVRDILRRALMGERFEYDFGDGKGPVELEISEEGLAVLLAEIEEGFDD